MDQTLHERIVRRIDQLLALSGGDRDVVSELHQGALSLAVSTYGLASPQIRYLQAVDAIHWLEVFSRSRGFLKTLSAELELGLVGDLRRLAAGEVNADLLALAREALNDGVIQVSAVCAAASFEDTLRRLGRENCGVEGRPKLFEVAKALRDQGVLKGALARQVEGNLATRNDALHADWEKLDKESVQNLIQLVDGLISRFFS